MMLEFKVEEIPARFKKPTAWAIGNLPRNQEGLKIIIYWLRSMCHAAYCDQIITCPRWCCRKGKDPMLDLATSIAWEAADVLAYELEFSKRRPYRISQTSASDSVKAIRTLYHVLGRHDEYQHMVDILKVTDAIVWNLRCL